MDEDRTTIVTISLNAVQRDTRIFQIAASLSRLGYRSIVVEQELSSLPRDELPFELVTYPGAQPPAEPQPEPAAGSIEEAGLRLRKGFRQIRDLGLKNRTLDRVLPPADLYYLNFFTEFPSVSRACKRHSAALVYESQDAHWAWPGYQQLPPLFRAWLKVTEQRCVRAASEFITVSDGVADMYESRYGRRPTLLRNVHDLRIDRESDLALRAECGLGADDFLLVVAGNDKPSDTIDEPLRAMTMLPDRVHLALIGRGWDLHAEKVRELGLAERVHIFPGVDPTQVTDTIAAADAALINIRSTDVHAHALPTRFFHAISAGLPILHPPLQSVRALSEEYELGPPIDAEDPESIARAVRSLVDDPELAATHRENVKRASEVLNWEVEERRLAELVASALSSR